MVTLEKKEVAIRKRLRRFKTTQCHGKAPEVKPCGREGHS